MGFFIEAGAFDGEISSNTLFFELKQNWTGLLVEPNPDIFQMLNLKVKCVHVRIFKVEEITFLSFTFSA